jgi:hypothetical protein
MSPPMFLDVLNVAPSQVGPAFSMRPQQFIEFRVHRLRVAVFGAVYEKGHQPSRRGSYATQPNASGEKTSQAIR